MKGTKLTALALVVYVLVSTVAYAQGDITGAWEVTIDSPQGAAIIDVTFKQAGEVVTGSITTPLGAFEFKGTLIDNALSVSSALEVQGSTLEVGLTAKVSGDTMAGKLVIGGLGEVPWTAKRRPLVVGGTAPPAAPETVAAAGDISGKWDIVMNIGRGVFSTVATLKQVGEQVTGSLGGQAGEEPVTGTMVGKTLTLEFRAATLQGDVAVTMTGDLGADGLAGRVRIAGMGDADWTGTRSK